MFRKVKKSQEREREGEEIKKKGDQRQRAQAWHACSTALQLEAGKLRGGQTRLWNSPYIFTKLFIFRYI